MALVFIFIAAVLVLLFVTRLAARRDAVRKAALAREAQAETSDRSEPRRD